MTISDGERWDARYRDIVTPVDITPPPILLEEVSHVAVGYRALDVASGLGDSGLYLAERGASVTLVDVSAVALEIAAQRALRAGLAVETVVADLANDPPPTGPWDVITCVHYLDRELLSLLSEKLSERGRLIVAVATTTNLQRHQRPSECFLLDPGELPTLVPGLRVLLHTERWRENGVHEAWMVAATR